MWQSIQNISSKQCLWSLNHQLLIILLTLNIFKIFVKQAETMFKQNIASKLLEIIAGRFKHVNIHLYFIFFSLI